jgi:malonyl-CoA/methylmalonyl-CoA synthetase
MSLVPAPAGAHGGRIAVVDGDGEHSYRKLLASSASAAAMLLSSTADLAGARVCFMVTPGWRYVAWQWAIWRAGGVAVPLCLTHPAPELGYVLDDARPFAVVVDDEFTPTVGPLAAERGLPLMASEVVTGGTPAPLPDVDTERPAMMLYTSGTTGRPKGVVTTHRNIVAQVESLVSAWEWVPEDRTLLALPLHHVHGIVNVLACAFWVGATVEVLRTFSPEPVWARLAAGDLSLFMAVPTIYHRLIGAWEESSPAERSAMSAGCRSLRLMVSGSAALPVPTLERWREISGHTLLERYGMTEIGMALSNPLHGERLPGRVGSPLPGVEVRLVDDDGNEIGDGIPGEIQVRGDTVFSEYWECPNATGEAFDGPWFRTGDVAVRQEGSYRILGRASVDILKSGGEKVSALEIEEVMLGHPSVAEVAVVGVPDPAWGDRVVAAVVAAGDPPDPAELRDWCRQRLAPAKVPKEVHLVDSLPRNAMGKVTKPDVVKMVSGS